MDIVNCVGPDFWMEALGAGLMVAAWVGALYGLYGLALLGRGWHRRRRLARLRTRRIIRQSWPLPRLTWE